MTTTPPAHAPIGFSSLPMVDVCEASHQMQQLVGPQAETDEEAEGTAWHLVAGAHASGNPWPTGVHFESSGRQWEVSTEMWVGARIWTRAIEAPHGMLRVEDAVRASLIHATDCWGTPDAWRKMDPQPWSKGLPVVRVAEYKAGHRYVEVFENVQLIGQGVGILERLDISEDVWFEFIVVQPRSFHRSGPVRTWRVLASDIRHIVNRLHDKVHAALAPSPTATVGAQCLDCKAAHLCETLQFSTQKVVSFAGRMQATELTPAAMGQELRMLTDARKLLDAREAALQAYVESTIRAGRSVPMWKLEAGRSSLKWNDDTDPASLGFAGDLWGIELRKPPAVITPTQARDAGVSEDILEQYATRLPGAQKLKFDNATDARKVFLYEHPDTVANYAK